MARLFMGLGVLGFIVHGDIQGGMVKIQLYALGGVDHVALHIDQEEDHQHSQDQRTDADPFAQAFEPEPVPVR